MHIITTYMQFPGGNGLLCKILPNFLDSTFVHQNCDDFGAPDEGLAHLSCTQVVHAESMAAEILEWERERGITGKWE